MFKHYFEQIDGVSIYPVFSLLVFFFFFLGLAWHVIKLDKKKQSYIEKLPLD